MLNNLPSGIRGVLKRPRFQTGLQAPLLSVLFFFFFTLLFFDWFVSVPWRAGRVDSYILFSTAETSRFYYAKIAPYNPLVLLNPNAKPGYVMISSVFLLLFPFGIFSLRLLSSLLSLGTLVVSYKLARKAGLSDFASSIAVIFILTSPLFFLASIAALSETLFCFSLVLAMYLLYAKRYLLLTLLTSCLPVIRQEGAIYLVIVFFFLLKEKRLRHAFFLPVPLFVWAFLNSSILGHSLFYPFFVSLDLPGPTSKSEVMPISGLGSLIRPILYNPAFLLFPFGAIISIFKRRCIPITVSLAVHILFFLSAAALQLIFIKQISYNLRYLVPIIPFLAIVSAVIFEKNNPENRIRAVTVLLTALALTAALIIQIRLLQKNPRVAARAFNQQQEREIREACIWLDDFMKKNNIRNIFYPGELTTDRIIGRVRFYLPPEAKIYPVRNFSEVYDPVVFKKFNNSFKDIMGSGIILVVDPVKEGALIIGEGTEPVKEFPSIPLYFYKGK